MTTTTPPLSAIFFMHDNHASCSLRLPSNHANSVFKRRLGSCSNCCHWRMHACANLRLIKHLSPFQMPNCSTQSIIFWEIPRWLTRCWKWRVTCIMVCSCDWCRHCRARCLADRHFSSLNHRDNPTANPPPVIRAITTPILKLEELPNQSALPPYWPLRCKRHPSSATTNNNGPHRPRSVSWASKKQCLWVWSVTRCQKPSPAAVRAVSAEVP